MGLSLTGSSSDQTLPSCTRWWKKRAGARRSFASWLSGLESSVAWNKSARASAAPRFYVNTVLATVTVVANPVGSLKLRDLSTFAGKKVVYPFEGRLISWVAREFDVRNVSVLRRGTHE